MREVKTYQDCQIHFIKSYCDPHEEIQALAREVLAARGLYRPPRGGVSGDRKIILEAPPKVRTGGMAILGIEGAGLERSQIDAIIAAGKTHQEDYFAVFRLSKPVPSKITDLWAHAMYATSWGYDDWYEFIILHGEGCCVKI